MLFRRKIYDKLSKWKNTSNGNTALLIEGARRVGKSTVAEYFAKNEYESYIIIDFAFAPKHIQDLFKDISDLDYFFLQLQLQYGVKLVKRRSLIIFDEIQFNSFARQAIKVLVKDGRYDYIETGSLISRKKNIQDILLPSEEKRIQMNPMDFEEFLWASGETDTAELIKTAWEKRISLGEDQNRNMMRKFRLYMLVGGMPQAVKTYIEGNNLKMVDEVKRDILQLYINDFFKIDNKGKISMLYNNIPSELNKHGRGYQISSVLPNERQNTVEDEISELIASKTVIPSYNVLDPSSGLSYMYSGSKFRLYVSDTGLLVTLMFMDKDFTDNTIYTKLLADKLPVNMGLIYENVVAQILTAKGNRVFYHTFSDKVKKRNYEIDFLLPENNGKFSPVEVKSSGYRTHRSIDVFSDKYSSRIESKFLVYTKDLKKEKDMLYIPVYMMQWI